MFIEKDRERLMRFVWSGLGFLVIAALLKFDNQFFKLFDSLLQTVFTSSETGFKTLIMKVISFMGSPTMTILYALVIAFFLWGFKYKIPALWVLLTVGGGDVIAHVVKDLVKRDRPLQHMAGDTGYSFPSGHVFGTFLIVGILFILVMPFIQSNLKRYVIEIILGLYVVVLAISRVYLYAHYPFDTIGAILLAYAWLQVAEWLYVYCAPRLQHIRFLANSDI